MYFLTFHPPTLTPTCALPAGGPIAWSMVGGHSASAPYPPRGQSREPHCTADRGESKCPPRPQPADQPILGCQGTGQESACTWPAVPSWGSASCLPGLAQSLRASPQLCSPQGPPQPCRAGTGPISRCGKRGVTWQWHRTLRKAKPGPQAHAHCPTLCFIMRAPRHFPGGRALRTASLVPTAPCRSF